MNDNLKKIIELSDCKWIQTHRGTLSEYWYIKDLDWFGCNVTGEQQDMYYAIWLPVGFNPETGKYQITDLLSELEKQLHERNITVDEYSEVYPRLAEIKFICLEQEKGKEIEK